MLQAGSGGWECGGGGGRDRTSGDPPAPTAPPGTDGRDVTCYFDISFLPFSFDFFSFLFSVFLPLSPFCSLDAAKRKAWKLNRVGSLRNIYSSSSTNTEGNAVPLPPAPPPTPTPPHRHGNAARSRMHPYCVCRLIPVVFPSFCLCVLFYHSCSFQLT